MLQPLLVAGGRCRCGRVRLIVPTRVVAARGRDAVLGEKRLPVRGEQRARLGLVERIDRREAVAQRAAERKIRRRSKNESGRHMMRR